MSKYGAIIAEARKPEREADEQANQIAGKPETKKTSNTANQKTSEAQNVLEIVKDEEVNLSIKVALRRRRYWMGQAKSKGETLTEAVTSALSERYGEPED